MSGPASLAIVVVTHDSAPDLERLLTSIDRHLGPSSEVVVVDSGSSDDSARVAGDHGAAVIELDGNDGFGAANNRGVAHVRADVTALVNPDIELLDDGLLRLADRARGERALLAPRLVHFDGSVQDSAHPLPGTARALLAGFVPYPLMPGPVRRRAQPWRAEWPVSVGWALAACLVGQTALLRHLGPFSARAPLFYEDLELCLAARREGISVVLDPRVRMRHAGGHSTRPRFGGEPYELLAQRRREVVGAALGHRALALDDLAQGLTFTTRWIARRATGRDASAAAARLRALRLARRASAARQGGEPGGPPARQPNSPS